MNIPRPLVWTVALLPWLVVLGVIGWLLVLRFPPSGVSRIEIPIDGRSPWFEPFLPGTRVTTAGHQSDGWTGQRMLQDPIYATARPPGKYDRVDVEVEMRSIRQPLVEFGIVRSQEPFAADMVPVWSDALAKGWHPATVGSVTGFVRDGLDDETLVRNSERVLLWHATTTDAERMDRPGPMLHYPVSLRGSVDLYVIPADGEISLTFALQDVNRNRHSGNVMSFRLSKDDEPLWTETVGVGVGQDGRPSPVYDKTIHVSRLKAGIYRLTLSSDDDVFIRRISTPLKHWVIGPRLFSGDTIGWSTSTQPLAVWTNSRHLAVETLHNEGLQTVTLGGASVVLKKTHEPYALDRAKNETDGSVSVRAPKGDVRIVGDGYFSFRQDALFLPRPRRLTDATDVAGEGVDAIVTGYQPAEVLSDGWVRFHASFALSSDQEKLKFALSAPGIFPRQGAVDVRRITFTYRRPPLSWGEWWRTVRRELIAAWKNV